MKVWMSMWRLIKMQKDFEPSKEEADELLKEFDKDKDKHIDLDKLNRY